MGTTAAEIMPPSASIVGPPNVPTQLNREPSQQELEAAQHLIEHSQSIQQRQPSESRQSDENARYAERDGDERSNGAPNYAHHDLSDSLQGFTPPYPSAQPQSNTVPIQRRQPANGMTPGGQMCRYVLLYEHDLKNQLT